MAPFVLLAIALAVAALGAVLVAVRQLLVGVKRLRGVVEATGTRVRPLLEELQNEAAVAATEVEALNERIAVLQASRAGSRSEPSRKARALD